MAVQIMKHGVVHKLGINTGDFVGLVVAQTSGEFAKRTAALELHIWVLKRGQIQKQQIGLSVLFCC